MSPEDEAEIAMLMRDARARSRGYASYFEWRIDRDLEELGVVQSLAESLAHDDKLFFSAPRARGRGSDPPDCEVLAVNGTRIAVEVTELVSEAAIREFKKGNTYAWADWSAQTFARRLAELVATKDGKFSQLRDAPYEGGYLVVVYTDEPNLWPARVCEYLESLVLPKAKHVDRAFLLVGYDPGIQRCPCFELKFAA